MSSSSQISQAELLRHFEAHCVSVVDYSDDPSTNRAMSFNELAEFFRQSGAVAPLTLPRQRELVRLIEPPEGRLITWTDFKIILEMVAQERFPKRSPADGLYLLLKGILAELSKNQSKRRTAGSNISVASEVQSEFSDLTSVSPSRSAAGESVAEAAGERHVNKSSSGDTTAPTTSVVKPKLARGFVYQPMDLVDVFTASKEFYLNHGAQELCNLVHLPGNSLYPPLVDGEDGMRGFPENAEHFWESMLPLGLKLWPGSTPMVVQELAYQLFHSRLDDLV